MTGTQIKGKEQLRGVVCFVFYFVYSSRRHEGLTSGFLGSRLVISQLVSQSVNQSLSSFSFPKVCLLFGEGRGIGNTHISIGGKYCIMYLYPSGVYYYYHLTSPCSSTSRVARPHGTDQPSVRLLTRGTTRACESARTRPEITCSGNVNRA